MGNDVSRASKGLINARMISKSTVVSKIIVAIM
jgi:hypothetical protein